jgi:hypothetical protein
VTRALMPLVDAYGAWIDAAARRSRSTATAPEDPQPAAQQGRRARAIASRPASSSWPTTSEVREAFQLMNRAMAMSARQRSPQRYVGRKQPTWRLFQLAFVLLNLVGVSDPTKPEEREEVELIFFPTGGGKTEAYLGVIALHAAAAAAAGPGPPGRGLGVAVLLRYTLRLLTLDQLGRAATLVCALELMRRKRPARLGDVRFAVGLWVGKSATANTLERGEEARHRLQEQPAKQPPSPFPLTDCPWCGTKLAPTASRSSRPRTAPTEVVVSCVSDPSLRRCEFANHNAEGLPVVFVDEQVYRELPAFLVATVDKFAMLPWRGETGCCSARRWRARGARSTGPSTASRARRERSARRAPAARADRAGRAAPDLGPAGHDGRAVRDRDRGAVRAGRRDGSADRSGPRSSRRPRRCGARAIRSRRCSGARPRRCSRRPASTLGDVLRDRRHEATRGGSTSASRRRVGR